MTPVSATPVSESDTTARDGLALLVCAAVKWLVVAGILGLLHSIQRHTPSFLQSIPALTYGRTQAMLETALVYGWAANAAYAAALWILARLGGAPWRGLALLKGGTIFWNTGVFAGLVCIAAGEGTMVPYLQMPAFLHPLLLVAGAAIATPAVLAWTGRRTDGTYAAQWYAVAALFLFPWLYTAGQVMLLASPVRGVAHPIVASWYGGSVFALWLAPVALAVAYYLVPKSTGRPVSHYEFAPHAFWLLVAVGSSVGLRQLAGSPVPAWLPAMGVAGAVLMVFHYVLVAINLAPAFGRPATAPLGFVRAGLVAYLAYGLVTLLVAPQGTAATLGLTHFDHALSELFLGGAFTLTVLGAVYDLVPRAAGVAWPSPGQVRLHYVLASGGLALSVIGLAGAGWVQGRGLGSADTSFAAIASGAKPFLLAATAGQAVMLLGAIVLAAHFFRLMACAICVPSRRAPVAVTVS